MPAYQSAEALQRASGWLSRTADGRAEIVAVVADGGRAVLPAGVHGWYMCRAGPMLERHRDVQADHLLRRIPSVPSAA